VGGGSLCTAAGNIVLPWPSLTALTHPREEPGAIAAHAGMVSRWSPDNWCGLDLMWPNPPSWNRMTASPSRGANIEAV
jgi:hypothetical protein